ncbi:radical SAM protein [Chloroflexota bacterium]
MFTPSYINLFHSGELKKRAERLEARLSACDICPHNCGVNRLNGEQGICHSAALPIVASVCAHHGEEPAISGSRGSGTIFFGNCNLSCIYCQNHQISQVWEKQRANETDCSTLAKHMLYLQNELCCHNINLVSPTHFVPLIVRAVLEAASLGLKIPLVYNTNGYDSALTLKELDGIIDIYLPDLRYANNKYAEKFSKAEDYVTHSHAAIKEMYRQTGNLVTDDDGIAERGLVVRHLILPAMLSGSRKSLTWLAEEISPEVTVSLMAQYSPLFRAGQTTMLNRKITLAEYNYVLALLDELGMKNGWTQEMESAGKYIPDFERKGHPFP